MYRTDMADDAHLRIGELSRRSGVSPELLRAWERRYGLLRPERSAGGLRLYSSGDLERVRAMQRHMTQGLAAREAAALAGRGAAEAAPRQAGVPVFAPEQARAELGDALEAFDEPRGQGVFDELLSTMSVDALVAEVVMPYLHDLGERWQRGELSVAQEHFASNVLRGRLLGLARGWGRGAGPRALLACPEDERHDLGLIAFGLALRERGLEDRLPGPGHAGREHRGGGSADGSCSGRPLRGPARAAGAGRGARSAVPRRNRRRGGEAGERPRRRAADRRPGDRGGAARQLSCGCVRSRTAGGGV